MKTHQSIDFFDVRLYICCHVIYNVNKHGNVKHSTNSLTPPQVAICFERLVVKTLLTQ